MNPAISETVSNAAAVAMQAEREAVTAANMTTAKGQGRRDVRCLPPNLNHWYALALSSAVEDKPVAVEIWGLLIALYRDQQSQVHALEDRCPHRQVKLSHGAVVGQNLECAYHAWQFDSAGNCAEVPYLEKNQKLPNCKIRSYPVREQDGFIWIWPGDATLLEPEIVTPETAALETAALPESSASEREADQATANAAPQSSVPLVIPEWDHLNYIATVSTIDCEAHFSFLIENLMDMYHGHLHRGFQAWASAALEHLEQTPDKVDALYTAESYYKIDKIWSISQLFFPALRRLHPEPLRVTYDYPNWTSSLGDDFRIYCLFVPVSPTQTRAHLIHFVSLNAFWRLHKLPVKFRRFVKDSLFGAAQKMLDGLVREDVVMLEEEQSAYLAQPERRAYELNRACLAVQRLIIQQADRTQAVESEASGTGALGG